MICARCKKEIKDGEQVVCWGPEDLPASVQLICWKCSDRLERTGELKDITHEIMG